MKRYVSLFQFTRQGVTALNKSTGRAAAFRKLAEKAGVKVEAQYWLVGAYDGLLILSAKSERDALQQLARLARAGNVRTQTFQALTADEFSAVVGK